MPERDAATLRVLVAGDVIPHRPRLLAPERLSEALLPLGPLFAKAHAVVANHEAAIVDDVDRYAPVRNALVASAGWTQALVRSRVAAVTLSNNHVCDGGLDGLRHTLGVVDELGLVGLGADLEDPFRARVLAAAGGRRVCAVAWTARLNLARSKCAASGKVALAPPTAAGNASISAAVKAARASGCDAVVAIGHAGDEYEVDNASGRAQAVVAAEAGATAVVLHHPHVPSGIEAVSTADGRRVPVFLSIGNLISNQGESWDESMRAVASDRRLVARNAWTRLGMVADLSFQWEKGAQAPLSVVWGYHLVWTEHERLSAKRASASDAKRDRILVRPLQPAGDIAIVRRLAADPLGPRNLFDSPCWFAVGPGCK